MANSGHHRLRAGTDNLVTSAGAFLPGGNRFIVYAVGSLAGGTFNLLVQQDTLN